MAPESPAEMRVFGGFSYFGMHGSRRADAIHVGAVSTSPSGPTGQAHGHGPQRREAIQIVR